MCADSVRPTRYAMRHDRRWRRPHSRYAVIRALALAGLLTMVATPGLVLAAAGSVLAPAGVVRTHVVRMVGDAKGFRFEPERIEIGAGDTLVFEVASGQPHDVAFDTTTMAPATTRQLSARLHDQIAPLAGPLLMKPGERYVVAFDGIAPGRYGFYCLPHQALQMKGEVVVR